MTPFADFTFFGLLLYAAIPTVLLGCFGWANARWALLVSVTLLVLQFSSFLDVRPGLAVREIWIVLGYAAYQWLITVALLRLKSRAAFYIALGLSILPLAVAKFLPIIAPDSAFGFLGISYVSFRAFDVIFSIRDRVVTAVPPVTYFAFLFFFPTISSGPIDRFRRFTQDWQRQRSRSEFRHDLDIALQRLMRGFLYKFLIAAMIRTHWMDPVAAGAGLKVLSYMDAYTFYLFFDFAGYSAFAISLGYLLGIRTPENFHLPFLSRNIRDFWNRWHISLSFWFRDHVYMRFLLTAAKGKWFKGRHTSSYCGLFVTFGLMGIWHGPELHYILYGLYHATVLSGFDAFARWNKQRKLWGDGPWWRAGSILCTFHVVAFGLLLFSGRITPHPPPAHEEVAEKVDCDGVVGFAWDRRKPNEPLMLDVFLDNLPIDRVGAGDFRQDLSERRFGNARHGFRFEIPAWARDGQPHTIELQVSENGRRLRGTPEVITCTAH